MILETLNARAKREGKRFARKKIKFIALVFSLLCILLLLLPSRSVAFADTKEEEAALAELEKNVEELLAELDTKELQKYLDTLASFKGTSVKEKLLSLITGDYALDYSSLGESVFHFVLEEAQTMLPAFAVILAVALLCGILNSAKNGFLNSTMSDMIGFVGYISVGAVTLA